MNPEETKPEAVFGVDYTAHFLANKGRHVFVGGTDLTIVEPDGVYWQTERISWDGLKVLHVENNIVIGVAYSPINDANEWEPFSYDIDTRVLKGGSYPNHTIIQKRWWKF